MPKVINGAELRAYQKDTENLPLGKKVLLAKYSEWRENSKATMNLLFIKEKNKNYKDKNYFGDDKDKEFIAYGFATNIEIKDSESALELVNIYKARWGIETFYKDSKWFFVKTTSNDSVVRDFFFTQCISVFNIWVLCNLVLFVLYLRKEPDSPKIRMGTFANSLRGICYKKEPPPSETA